jgi:hypothetical protein
MSKSRMCGQRVLITKVMSCLFTDESEEDDNEYDDEDTEDESDYKVSTFLAFKSY